jgi:ligand-binding sensor protein
MDLQRRVDWMRIWERKLTWIFAIQKVHRVGFFVGKLNLWILFLCSKSKERNHPNQRALCRLPQTKSTKEQTADQKQQIYASTLLCKAEVHTVALPVLNKDPLAGTELKGGCKSRVTTKDSFILTIPL